MGMVESLWMLESKRTQLGFADGLATLKATGGGLAKG